MIWKYFAAVVYAGPLFTMRANVLLSNLVKSLSREIGSHNDCIALIFDKLLGGGAVDVTLKCQSDFTRYSRYFTSETSARFVHKCFGSPRNWSGTVTYILGMDKFEQGTTTYKLYNRKFCYKNNISFKQI